MFAQIHKFMKEKPLQSFLIIVVLILLTYYVYTRFFRKEHYDMKDMKDIGYGASISYSSLCIICMIIPYLILYYIIKIANKNAIIESTQS